MTTDVTLTTSFGGRNLAVSGWVREIRWDHAVGEPVTMEVSIVVGHVDDDPAFVPVEGSIGDMMQDPNQTLDALEWLASRIEEVVRQGRTGS